MEILDKFGQEWQVDGGNFAPGTNVVTADISNTAQFSLIGISGLQMALVYGIVSRCLFLSSDLG
jgi:hypothetical protein